MKTIRPDHRILIIGTSRQPFTAPPKQFIPLWNRFIYFGYPDYLSRLQTWTSLIQKANGVITPALDISMLTKISEGYTAGAVSYQFFCLLTLADCSSSEPDSYGKPCSNGKLPLT